jgi:Cof subfamily protein (haloacid dehalogenase superfamily)
VWEDGRLRPRTLEVLRRVRDAGIHVIVVTGRMARSIELALVPAALDDPFICYQGAVVADADGTWLRHEPLPLELARETIAAVNEEGYDPNVYVDDELYVSRLSEGSRAYAEFQHIPVHEVGDTLAWLERPPTKLVCVGDPDALDATERRLKERFGDRMYISKSLPYFLEFAQAGVTKAAGLQFLAEHLGFTAADAVAFGDGENDVELVDWAGFGVAVENAHDRVKAVADWVCPPAQVEGVAQVLESYLEHLGESAPSA